eukprot:gene8179-7_t
MNEELIFEKILINNRDLKSCFILCHDSKNQKAILILNKLTFSEDQIKKILSKETKKETVQDNEKYSKHKIFYKEEIVDSNLIYPASEKEILKYSPQNYFYFKEDSLTYENVVKPYIDENSKVLWIENLINKTSKEEILFENENFILCPNPKWNQNDIEELNCLLVIKDSTIKSVRDLNSYKLVENMQTETMKFLNSRFNASSSKIIGYIHYLPTYWHFHIHFSSISSPIFGRDQCIGKAILLSKHKK